MHRAKTLPAPEHQHWAHQKMQDIRKAAPEHDKAWQRCKVNTIWSFRIRRVFPVCKIEVEAPYIYICVCVCVCVFVYGYSTVKNDLTKVDSAQSQDTACLRTSASVSPENAGYPQSSTCMRRGMATLHTKYHQFLWNPTRLSSLQD